MAQATDPLRIITRRTIGVIEPRQPAPRLNRAERFADAVIARHATWMLVRPLLLVYASPQFARILLHAPWIVRARFQSMLRGGATYHFHNRLNSISAGVTEGAPSQRTAALHNFRSEYVTRINTLLREISGAHRQAALLHGSTNRISVVRQGGLEVAGSQARYFNFAPFWRRFFTCLISGQDTRLAQPGFGARAATSQRRPASAIFESVVHLLNVWSGAEPLPPTRIPAMAAATSAVRPRLRLTAIRYANERGHPDAPANLHRSSIAYSTTSFFPRFQFGMNLLQQSPASSIDRYFRSLTHNLMARVHAERSSRSASTSTTLNQLKGLPVLALRNTRAFDTTMLNQQHGLLTKAVRELARMPAKPAPPSVDLNELSEQVYDEIERRIVNERQRRGLTT